MLRNVKEIVPSTKGVHYRIIFPSFEFTGVNTETKVTSDELVITHAGRIASGKGQRDAVIACKAIANAGISFRLELLGGIEDENTSAELQQIIDKNGLADKVAIRGHVTNVNEMLAASDIFLFPSYGEGMANAFIEALHFGMPCIAYNNTVFPEFIELGFHIILAEDRNIDDLTKKLMNTIQNIDEEKAAACDNTKLAKEYFNIKSEQDSWADILL